MQRQIGVSIITCLPNFLQYGGYGGISEKLDGMGIQLLPLRGLRKKHILNFNVLSFEGPWNCGSLFDAVKRQIGIKGDYPSLIDFGLFGSERSCRAKVQMIHSYYPGALAIDTPWVPGSVIEMSPDMNAGNARQWGVQKPSGIVLDTYHWRRFSETEALRALEELGGWGRLRMVHLKLMSSSEADSFLHQKDDQNALLLRMFLSQDEKKQIPVIIEAKNNALGKKNFEETLARVRERIQSVLS